LKIISISNHGLLGCDAALCHVVVGYQCFREHCMASQSRRLQLESSLQ